VLSLTLFETKPATLVKEVRSARSQIDNLWTAVSVLFQPRTFRAVVRVRDTWRTADDTTPSVSAEITFITDSNESFWSDV